MIRYECEVSIPVIPPEGKTPQLRVRMPDTPITVWVVEDGGFYATFPNQRGRRDAFAKSQNLDGIKGELHARWKKVGDLREIK